MIDSIGIPIDANIEDQIAWYAREADQLERLTTDLRKLKARIAEYVRDAGPSVTPYGMVEIAPAGYDWDEQSVAIARPQLATGARLVVEGSVSQIERAASMVAEEMPAVQWDISRTIDKLAADRAIKAGGETAAVLEPLRTRRNGSLRVRKISADG